MFEHFGEPAGEYSYRVELLFGQPRDQTIEAIFNFGAGFSREGFANCPIYESSFTPPVGSADCKAFEQNNRSRLEVSWALIATSMDYPEAADAAPLSISHPSVCSLSKSIRWRAGETGSGRCRRCDRRRDRTGTDIRSPFLSTPSPCGDWPPPSRACRRA